jgi:acyl carrier protein
MAGTVEPRYFTPAEGRLVRKRIVALLKERFGISNRDAEDFVGEGSRAVFDRLLKKLDADSMDAVEITIEIEEALAEPE